MLLEWPFSNTVVTEHIQSHTFTMVEDQRTPENYTMLQGFEWNVPADGKHYQRLRDQVGALRNIGVTNIWLPPGCKASSAEVCHEDRTVRLLSD